MMSTLIGRDVFLSHLSLPREEIAIPLLGGSVYVRTLTARERDRYEVAQHEANQRERGLDYRARLVQMTTCYSTGTPLFFDEDLERLGNLSCALLDPIVETALRLNRFTAGDVAELEKNSESSLC
jgi:hypothetical protein